MQDTLIENINNDPLLYASYQFGKLKQYILEEGSDYRSQEQLKAWQHVLSLLLIERDLVLLKGYETKVYKDE